VATNFSKSEEITFQKSAFKFTECNPFELAKIRIACFKVSNPAVVEKVNEQGGIKRHDEASLQGLLITESEMVSTGVLKIDIYDESDAVMQDNMNLSEAQN